MSAGGGSRKENEMDVMRAAVESSRNLQDPLPVEESASGRPEATVRRSGVGVSSGSVGVEVLQRLRSGGKKGEPKVHLSADVFEPLIIDLRRYTLRNDMEFGVFLEGLCTEFREAWSKSPQITLGGVISEEFGAWIERQEEAGTAVRRLHFKAGKGLRRDLRLVALELDVKVGTLLMAVLWDGWRRVVEGR